MTVGLVGPLGGDNLLVSHVAHLHELLYGTTCARYGKVFKKNGFSTGEQCLCCCGPYIPDVDDGSCKDIRRVFSGIDNTFSNLTSSLPIMTF